jgi:hypothetical protein
MPVPATIATRNSWKTEPLPDQRATLQLDATYSSEEFERLRRGLIPQQMEDKWFILFEEPWLYFYRSWTGYAIYGIRFEQRGDTHRIVEAWVSRDSHQYPSDSIEHDVATLKMILHMRVRKDAASPPPNEMIEEWRHTLLQPRPSRPLPFWQRLIRRFVGR